MNDMSKPKGMSSGLVLVFALACGAMVSNLYYAQALIGLISPDLGLHEGLAGLIVTLTQFGYGAGLMLVVTLADLVENRRLILVSTAGAIVGLVGAALSDSAGTFLAASFVVGFCSVGAQVLVPFAAHLTPEHRRGRVIGNVMGGLLAGIMLARPLANLVASAFGWRAIFWLSAVFMLAIWAMLARSLPRRQPTPGMHYGRILWSTVRLLKTEPVLRRRACYQGIIFACFNLFWTAVPLMLAQRFGLGQQGIAVFALAGAGGALAAPVAGRLADRGFTRLGSGLAMMALIVSFLVAGWAAAAHLLIVAALAAIALDAATQTNQVLSQRAVYALSAEARGRLNAAFMTIVFTGGALGSALAAITFFHGGWWLTSLTGAGLGVLVLGIFATESRDTKPPNAKPQ
jgi:predicted MFS family arabinose efflux permease